MSFCNVGFRDKGVAFVEGFPIVRRCSSVRYNVTYLRVIYGCFNESCSLRSLSGLYFTAARKISVLNVGRTTGAVKLRAAYTEAAVKVLYRTPLPYVVR